MKELFPSKKRDLLASGLMRAVSLSLAAMMVSEAIWKSSLKVKVILVIILFALLVVAWVACPVGETKRE